MQSVCALLANNYAQRVVELRSALCEDPALGAIYDPPFVHFTLQLAEDYDWEALEPALLDLAERMEPFELRTTWLLVSTGASSAIAIAPFPDDKLLAFQAAVWQTITPHARGRIDRFYEPGRWVPHVTVKRCGSDPESLGRAMSRLAGETFSWTMPIDTIAVQHDPGKNSLTHYQRLCMGLGPSGQTTTRIATPELDTNATILQIEEHRTGDSGVEWLLRVQLDDESQVERRWSAAEVVRVMAEAGASTVHFPGARCKVDGQVVTAVCANTPQPVALRAVTR